MIHVSGYTPFLIHVIRADTHTIHTLFGSAPDTH
jgi:hypothetical protein